MSRPRNEMSFLADVHAEDVLSSNESDNDVPLANLLSKRQSEKKSLTPSNGTNGKDCSSSDDDLPLKVIMTKLSKEKSNTASNADNSSSYDNRPLSKLVSKKKTETSNKDQRTTSKMDANEVCTSILDSDVLKAAKKNKKKFNAKLKAHSKNDDSSDEDVPLSKILKTLRNNNSKKRTSNKNEDSSRSGDDGPVSALVKQNQKESLNPGKKAVIESDDSEDDVPLSKLKTSTQSTRKSVPPKHKERCDVDRSESDLSTDDEPLVKKKTPASNKKAEHKKKTTKCNILKKKTEIKRSSITKVKEAVKTKKENVVKSDSSDDEPLSEVIKKLNKQKTSPGETRISKRCAATKRVKYVESSCETSDSEPLKVPAKKKSPPAKYAPTKSKQGKYVESSDNSDEDVPLANLKRSTFSSDKSLPAKQKSTKQSKYVKSTDSSDDDLPLAKLGTFKSHAQKRMKCTPAKGTQEETKSSKDLDSSEDSDDDKPLSKIKTSNAAKKTASSAKRTQAKQMLSSESSDNEPLINLVKKAAGGARTNTSSENSTSFEEPKEAIMPDDESQMRVADCIDLKNIPKVILKRCHLKET